MVYRFEVRMELEDDDQTDPVEMAEMISDLLNCKDSMAANWQQAMEETEPEARPKFVVRVAKGART